MVLYTLLKKYAFAVLKCQKNGPSDQSEMTQDQSWTQVAHVLSQLHVVLYVDDFVFYSSDQAKEVLFKKLL